MAITLISDVVSLTYLLTYLLIVPLAHPTIAIFESGLPYELSILPRKFRDDISNGSRVIVSTEIKTNRQSNKVTNRHY